MDGIPGALACGKLSKKTLFSLPAGGLLTSNVTDDIGHPLVAEPVAPLAEREAQWQRIKGKGADSRSFVLFVDKAAYSKQWAQCPNLPLNKMGI